MPSVEPTASAEMRGRLFLQSYGVSPLRKPWMLVTACERMAAAPDVFGEPNPTAVSPAAARSAKREHGRRGETAARPGARRVGAALPSTA